MVLIWCPAQIKANRLRVYNAGEKSVCACSAGCMYVSILGQIGLNITQGIVKKAA